MGIGDWGLGLIRASIRNLEFPIWVIPYGEQLDVNIEKTIGLLVKLVGSTDASEQSSFAESIGELDSCEEFRITLRRTITKEKCWNGMQEYLKQYRDGAFLSEAKRFDCNNPLQYLSAKQTQDSPWLWDRETTDSSIDDTIQEFQLIGIIHETLSDSCNDLDSAKLWIDRWIKSLIIPLNVIRDKITKYSEPLAALESFANVSQDRATISSVLKQSVVFDELFKISKDIPALFKAIYPEDFNNYTSDEISAIVKILPEGDNNRFSNEEFYNLLLKAISEYNSGLKKNELINYWKMNTDSSSPADWSVKHLTPIEVVSSEDTYATKILINVLNGIITKPEYVEASLDYLKNSNYLDLLNDSKYVDDCFREKLLGIYSTIFDELDSIRKSLYDRQKNVDEWLNMPDTIKQLSRNEYDRTAKKRALNIINSIPLEKLQEYLRNQVESNMNLGIELLQKKE